MNRRPPVTGSIVAACAALLAMSCTPPPPPEHAEVAVQPAPAANVAAAELAPTYDPVAEPEGLAGVVRIGSPVADLVMLRDVLPAHTAFGELASLGPQTVAQVVFGSLGKIVDVAAPLDMVVLKDRSAALVGSLVLRDFEQSRAQLAADFDFEPSSIGLLVKPKQRSKHTGMIATSGIACSVMRGGAPPADHLVCAGDAASLEHAGPYVARTLSRRPAGVGLRFEIPESAFRAAMAEQQQKLDDDGEPARSPSEEAGRRLGKEAVLDLGNDFQDMGMDLALGPAGLSAGLDLRFRSLKSVIALAVVGTAGSGTPPSFWKLPGDADLALYVPGAAPDAIRPLGNKLWSQIAESIPETDYPREMSRDIAGKFAKLFITGGPWMIAHGPTPKAAGARRAGGDSAAQYREARAAANGWTIIAMPEPSAAWTNGLHELLKLNASASKRPAGTGASSPPKKRPARQTTSTTREVPVRPTDGLPAGAIHVVHHVAPEPGFTPSRAHPALEADYDVHIFVAGTATDTWFALGENEALARTKLHEAMTGDAGTLGDRSELAPLRGATAGGVGFFSLAALAGLLDDIDTSGQLAQRTDELGALASLPSAGSTPLLVSFGPKSTADKGGAALRVNLALSLAGVIDIVQWLQ